MLNTMHSSLLLAVMVLVFIHTACCGILDEQACAERIQKECRSCDFALAISKSKNTKKHLCKELQSCADCMAIPRCQSSYVDQYRALLQTVFSTRTKFCSNFNFHSFYGGIEKACKGSGKVYDHCGHQCNCEDGHYTNCFRVRKEFTQMSFEERRRFVDAYYKATTDPLLKDDFQKILSGHGLIPTDYLHHMAQIFFPWHRWFLLQAENFLRQIDCRVTIPYYQWTAAGKNVFRTTNPRDVWSSGPQGIGGNGAPPDYCVMDGKFRKGNWRLPLSKGGGCLKRDFRGNCALYKEKQLNKLLDSKFFEYFQSVVREELHSSFHDCIGGTMPDTQRSGNAPEVLLHHSFMDKIWDQWQKKSDDVSRNKYFKSNNVKMPLADMYSWRFVDNNNLPGNVGVVYEKFKETSQQNIVKDIEGEEIGEDEGNLTDEENFTDEQPENDRELPDEQADGNVED